MRYHLTRSCSDAPHKKYHPLSTPAQIKVPLYLNALLKFTSESVLENLNLIYKLISDRRANPKFL